jgi:tetratricopeptide (TPR) repeat protein
MTVPGSRIRRWLARALLSREARRTQDWESRFHAAMTAHREGRNDEAVRRYAQALAIAERFPPTDRRLVATITALVGFHRWAGDPAAAETLCRRALGLKESILGPDHPEVATTLEDLSGILKALGRPEEAAPLHERALAILERAIGPDFSELAESLRKSALMDPSPDD